MQIKRHVSRISAISILLVVTAGVTQAKDNQESPLPKGVGRLWNISADPFTFQLGTTTGSGWSAPITLAPGKYKEIKMPPPGQPTEIAGLHDRNAHVKIQSRQPFGVVRVSLPARTARDELVPQWFYVKDSNGFGRMVQAASVEEAKQRQTDLQSRPKMTPQEIERIKEALRANYVLVDES